MPVEVIGLEVQENRELRLEALDVLELEARQLADDALGLPHLAFELAQRSPDVSGSWRAEDRAEQLRRRRLPVRPGDADDRVAQIARGELDLAPDRDATLACRDDERRFTGDAGALDEHLDAVEQPEVGVVSERALGHDHLHAVCLEQRLRRPSRARQAEHECALHSLNWR